MCEQSKRVKEKLKHMAQNLEKAEMLLNSLGVKRDYNLMKEVSELRKDCITLNNKLEA